MTEERAVKMGFERAAELEQVKLGDCLWDVHAAGMKLLEFTSGRSFDDYNQSELLQSVVKTMLEIMADRLNQMRRQFPAEFAKIADASRLIDTAESTDLPKLWRTVEEAVPEAVAEARAVLEHWHEA
jgi:uncharacterized protein with HEPN domain